ncbi:MAG TPA: 2Fe-2S iron-sulfur cluster binding domain-containing protein [Myxococcales bacterium]|nr:2Fe-2S iron-sulfur cluster binding domain-containing protein [Myxococcales bacterium]HIN85951.1 2Fe-2S iron-sulfur cluster binding domain-containing protein [Myxococcales bacterium]
MSNAFTIRLNGRELSCQSGETILTVAERAGINIPTLCHDPRLDPAGACRSCLVEVDGQRRLQPACAFKVTPDLAITSENDRVKQHRELLLAFYMADHAPNGNSPESANGNQLLEMVHEYGNGHEFPSVHSPREGRPTETNPYFNFHPELCILCARCTRYCDEVEAVSAITLSERGAATTIATANQISLMDSSCELCGGCVDTCPTGALTEKKPGHVQESNVTKVRTTCNYCGVGCQMDLNVRDNQVIKVTSPPPGETLNDGNLCVKGRFAYDFIHHEERLKTPLIRGEDGHLHEASWEEAIQAAADGLNGVKARHGANALGFISSSRCTGEENYLMQKLARAAFGTNNVHQCAAT